MVRAYRDRLAWLSLGTDLVPIIAIILFHWGPTPLAALYWLENLVIGGYTILRLAVSALASGEGMIWFVAAIILSNALFFAADFIGKGEFRQTNPPTEMFAPYGRIVTLHVAIIPGAFLSISTRQPLLGVLVLIMIRARVRDHAVDDAPSTPGWPTG